MLKILANVLIIDLQGYKQKAGQLARLAKNHSLVGV